MTAEQIEALATELASVAAIFVPGSAVAIGALLQAGTKLNALIGQIRAQTEADAPEVWAKVQADFADAVSAWEASNAPHA